VRLEQLQNMPPQMTRRRTINSPKQCLLDAASSLFCQHGINSVGIDAIVLQAGTAKTTHYKLFGSKDRLVEEVLKAEGKAWRDWFTTALQNVGGSPRNRLEAIFPVLSQWLARSGMPKAVLWLPLH
jgi:AcrR family transcriptional regulator